MFSQAVNVLGDEMPKKINCEEALQTALHHLEHDRKGIAMSVIKVYERCHEKQESSCEYKGKNCAVQDVIKGLGCIQKD